VPALASIFCWNPNAREEFTDFAIAQTYIGHLFNRSEDPLFAQMRSHQTIRHSVSVGNLRGPQARFALGFSLDSKLDHGVANGASGGKYFLGNLGYRKPFKDVFLMEEIFVFPRLLVYKINGVVNLRV
jgi:hypothetical protein